MVPIWSFLKFFNFESSMISPKSKKKLVLMNCNFVEKSKLIGQLYQPNKKLLNSQTKFASFQSSFKKFIARFIYFWQLLSRWFFFLLFKNYHQIPISSVISSSSSLNCYKTISFMVLIILCASKSNQVDWT